MVDVETSGLDWRHNHIVGYVVTFSPKPQDSYYVPFRHLGSANVGGLNGPKTATGWDGSLAPGEADLIQAIDAPGTTIVGHHLAFDTKFMSRVGYKFRPRHEDTMINAPMIDELVGRYSLESCAHRHKVQAKKSAEIVAYLRSKFPEIKEGDKDAMGHFWRLPGNDPMAVEYATGDGTTTWQLCDAQMVEIRKTDRWVPKRGEEPVEIPSMELVWDIESRLIPVLGRMMTRGIRVDVGQLELTRTEIDQTIEQALNSLPSEFNVRSPKDVRGWMEKHGHTDWPMTEPSLSFPHGQPSFPESWLETHPAGKLVVDVRKYTTLRDTFFNPLKEQHLYKERVHTNLHQLRNDDYGTVTGRLSSSDPNLQAAPKHDEDIGKLFRRCFTPDYGKWGEDDYSQIEPRLLAYYSRCKVLLNGYRSEPFIDAHTAASSAMNPEWNSLDPKAQKSYRNEYGKRINQTLITGGGEKALVKKYKMDPRDVRQKIRDYFRAMPEIKQLQKKSSTIFRERGYLISLLNRRMRLDDPRYDYRGMNRILQTGNADCLKLKLVEMGEYLETQGGAECGVELLLNCHDACSFQFDEDARPIYDACLDIMQDFSSENAVIKLDVPITVDCGEGASWAEATWGK